MVENSSNGIFSKLQLKLLLECAQLENISPDNEFCINWINSNSENIRKCWDESVCKNCKYNINCLYVLELLKNELVDHCSLPV